MLSQKQVTWLSLLFSLALLGLFIAASYYFRPSGDDYWAMHHLKITGFWDGNWYAITHWGARYTATFLGSAYYDLSNFKHYWIVGTSLLVLTQPALYFLLRGWLKELPHLTLWMTALAFNIAQILIAKPGALGGAEYVLAGQYYWIPGALCYQSSLIVLYLIGGCVLRCDTHWCYTPLSLIGCFLLVGTNEGSSILFFLFCCYQVYRQLMDKKPLSPWLDMSLLILVLFIVQYYTPGLQNRMAYYQVYIWKYPFRHDFVLNSQLMVSQCFWLIMFTVLNPFFWGVAWLLQAQLKSIRLFFEKRMPMRDIHVAIPCLLAIAFFLSAWTMGVRGLPRYYSVMSTLSLFWLLIVSTYVPEWPYARTLIQWMRVRPWLYSIAAMALCVLLVLLSPWLTPNIDNAYQALKQGPVFTAAYAKLATSVKAQVAAGKDTIIVRQNQLLPPTPILRYGATSPTLPLHQQTQKSVTKYGLAYSMAYGFGPDYVNTKVLP